MKKFALFALTLFYLVAGTASAQALTFAYKTLELEEEDIESFTAIVEESGTYTMKVSSYTGDPDLYFYDQSSGRQIAAGDNVGDDRITLNLPPGTYSVVVRMASCGNSPNFCYTNVSMGRRLESGRDRIDILEWCIDELRNDGLGIGNATQTCLQM